MKILENEPFTTWTSTDGMTYRLMDETHTGYWPATPSSLYQLQVTLMASNLIGHTNDLYTADGVTIASDLMITEYVEGSSTNKAIEIFNGTAAAIDLSGYGFRLQMNNTTEWGDYEALPARTLPPGSAFVIVHPDSDATLKAKADWENSKICIFNGNDSIFLFKGMGSEDPIDAMGASPCDGYAYENRTLRRYTSAVQPKPVYDPAEWATFPVDTFDGLGIHELDGANGKPMLFTVDDDDVEEPEITDVQVNAVTPTASSPGPAIILADVPASGLPITWKIQDVDSGIYAASNGYTLRTGNTVVATGWLPAGSYQDGDGRNAPIPLSVDVPREGLKGGNYSLTLVGYDVDPEWVGDSMVASNQYFFQLLSPDLKVTPTMIDFGQMGVGMAAQEIITISNHGNMDAVIEEFDFVGTGYAFFEADVSTITVPAGGSVDVTISFTPVGGGNFNWVLYLRDDDPSHSDLEVQLRGSCYDPETTPPTVVAYNITDGEAIPNKVTDHAAVHGELTASFTLYQYTGMRPDSASFDLLYPDGTFAAENVPLMASGSVEVDGNLCTVFVGAPPPFYPGTLGVYTARVSAISSNGIEVVDEAYFQTVGAGVQELLETFNDAVQSGNAGSYDSGSAIADLGTWTYIGTRWDQTISGKAPTMRAQGSLKSPVLSGGCVQITFDYRHPFSESGVFNVDVLVNNTVVGTVTAMPPDTVTVYTHTIAGLDFEGDVTITFTNRASSNKRIAIDNLQILTLGTDTSAPMTIQVVDEDTTGPVHSGFNVDSAYFSTNDFFPDGLVVTGLVSDLQSGVYAASNVWSLVSNGHVIASGTMNMLPAENGAGISNDTAALSVTIPGILLDWVDGQFLFQVMSTDYDVDRPGDWATSSNQYAFGISAYVPCPTNFTAESDGPEMVKLRWDPNDAVNVVVLWATNGPIAMNSIPKGTEPGAIGSIAPAGTRVAYSGDAQGYVKVVVPPASRNYFRIFGRMGTTYSAAYADPSNAVDTLNYERGEIVDQFAFTNGFSLAEQSTLSTGQGWKGPWFGADTTLFRIDDTNLLSGTIGYPTPYANKLQLINNSTTVFTNEIRRMLATPRHGRTFVAFMMNYKVGYTNEVPEWGADPRDMFVGLSLMSGENAATEEIFFGKPFADDANAGIYVPEVPHRQGSSYWLKPNHLEDYMFVGEWDPEMDTIRLWAFHWNQDDPILENYEEALSQVVAVYSNSALSIAPITGIRVAAGISIERQNQSLDHVYFDEIRVGSTWDEVLNFTYPKVFDYVLDHGTNWISDGQLSEIGKNYPVSFTVYHRTRIKAAEFNLHKLVVPENFIYDPTNQPVFSNYTYTASGRQIFTNVVTQRVPTQDVALATYTSRVWVTSVSDKTTNTITLSEQPGAEDLFFGEFGEGNYFDKFVEIYNGTGNAIDLSQYFLASQTKDELKYIVWTNIFPLAHETTWLEHGTTIAVVNGGKKGLVGTANQAIRQEFLDALTAEGRPYILSSNDLLTVSGDDPVGLFRWSNTNEWLDVCGIGPNADRYIMQRMEDAEVPWYYPERVNTNQWDFREWLSNNDLLDGCTNFISTAGAYDRIVGLGGFILFHVYDDDTDPPVVGSDTALMVGSAEPYQAIERSPGLREVVFSAWSFTNSASPEACRAPWWGSLFTNAVITWSDNYPIELVSTNDAGTGLNDTFDEYSQPNRGALYMSGIGGYGFNATNVPWIQFELPLVAAEELTLSWAEKGGSYSFENVSIQWSASGVEGTFQTSEHWPEYTMTDYSDWRIRLIEFNNVVPKGLDRVFIRFVLGPEYGGTTGGFRMDNIQLTGVPDEFIITDGQIADSGYQIQVRGNVYDPDSGIQRSKAAMRLGSVAGMVDDTKSTGDGIATNSTLWWDVGSADGGTISRDELTDLVYESQTGLGLPLSLDIPDADVDRADDVTWFRGSMGKVRVIDDDTVRPKLTLATMQPRTGILAQWLFPTTTNGTFATKADSSVEASALMCETINGTKSTPRFSSTGVISPTSGTFAVRQSGWHYQSKFWHVELKPEYDMGISNLTFQSLINKDNGPKWFTIQKWVNGVSNQTWGPFYFTGSPSTPISTNTWYSWSWKTAVPGQVIDVRADEETQIRIHGYGAASNSIGTFWYLYNLTMEQGALSDESSVTEVTDEEFTSGSFKLRGNTWDIHSGIRGPLSANEAKRPRFSMHAPDGGVFATNVPFVFDIGAFEDGALKLEANGGFEAPLPRPSYTNVMLGEYRGTAEVWDFDDDRTDDDLKMAADLAMYVVDNDVTEPSAVGNVRVNGVLQTETAPDRHVVTWTNQPEFIVTFDTLAEDQPGAEELSPKQRAITGIGEYRVATNDVNSLAASNRANVGIGYAVAATNGALPNAGFERSGEGWTLNANCSYQTLASDPDLVHEGMNSLKQTGGGVAYQWIEFRNTEGTAPKIAVSGWYQSANGATFRVEAFTTNDLTIPVATRTITLGTADEWTMFQINPAEDLGNGQVEVIKVSLVNGASGETYWDDIRFSLDVGNNLPAMRYLATPESQGVNPQFVFAVDADNNRLNDRLAGEAKPFYVAYDITPPTRIRLLSHDTGATTDSVDDPTTQFDLRWYTSHGGQVVGPDDPGNANHPTKVTTDTDLLSPWMTYKIYFGTYNTLDVPEGDNPINETTGFVYTNYIVNNAYRTWPSITASSKIEDQSTTLTNYSTLTNMTQTGGNVYSNRVYNLDFDQDYIVVVVGVDKAGNEGPAGIFSWATNNTIKFALTRGWKLPKASALAAFPGAPSLSDTNRLSAMGVAWTAAGPTNEWGQYTMVTKEYDMIYWDSSSFRDSSNNVWQLVGTVNSNWYADDGGQERARGNIRFYRASYRDRWRKELQVGGQTVKQRPLASEEVYAMHNIVLSGGQNFVALHGVPYSNSFAAVFGDTNTFPGGTSASPGSGATVVEFYSPGTNALTSEQYWLNTAGEWWRAGGIEVTHTVLTNRNFFTRGFSIHLPSPLPEAYVTTNAFDSRMYRDEEQQRIPVPAMVWSPILQVPTNDFSQTIYTGETIGRVKTCVYNLTALRLPVAAHPRQMRLLECGFVRAANYADGDIIYTINTSTKDVLSGRGIWCDNNGVWRFADQNSGVVPAAYFKPNDVIIIVSRNKVGSGSWLWTYSPTNFYTLPTRWMGN